MVCMDNLLLLFILFFPTFSEALISEPASLNETKVVEYLAYRAKMILFIGKSMGIFFSCLDVFFLPLILNYFTFHRL